MTHVFDVIAPYLELGDNCCTTSAYRDGYQTAATVLVLQTFQPWSAFARILLLTLMSYFIIVHFLSGVGSHLESWKLDFNAMFPTIADSVHIRRHQSESTSYIAQALELFRAILYGCCCCHQVNKLSINYNYHSERSSCIKISPWLKHFVYTLPKLQAFASCSLWRRRPGVKCFEITCMHIEGVLSVSAITISFITRSITWPWWRL